MTSGIVVALNMRDVIVPAIERLIGTYPVGRGVHDHPVAVRPAVGRCQQHSMVSLVLSLLATLYPSWRAARINPAEALRYE